MSTTRGLLIALGATCVVGLLGTFSGGVVGTPPAESHPLPSPTAAAFRLHPEPARSSSVPPTVRKSNQASKRNCGSAATLVGPVCLGHLFVDDSRSHWTDGGKQLVRQRMAAAVAFLNREARRYGVKLSIAEQELPDARCPQTISKEMFTDPVWIEAAAKAAGYRSVNTLVQSLGEQHQHAQALLVVHVNRDSTSYNLSYYRGVSSDFYGERIVMFINYQSGQPTCAASYAHEILHAFGAGELFFPFDATRARYELARRWFGNDIMFRVDRDLGGLSIGSYTAYRIGWTERLEERFRQFED